MNKNNITAVDVDAFLESVMDASFEASDMAEKLSKQIKLDGDKPSCRASTALHIADRFMDLAKRLSVLARHEEDMRVLREELKASQ